ncbi:type II toxin-antitoxin system RelE/ParE family toxin [Polynucleobacter sp. AP-Ainpum-60-G11]|uniref:type II toxin-antitoxin system RelE/ParE family toxin n=1 Tax=Polynucleobacter sp. AP-Ainpum-60-G11 TaxID=2576926 RepID=UPI001BFDB5D2|nr:type II toxin-antitoxin system RelE/ParE family toxin [Polynucleobacter sp. AP-Ainpum-60-G11]QWE27388.1 type II toxin-antitoxin system RelE/ParE family toxin [Polynucleobacter sp. AP-Ainpum-60-G11]
MIEIRKTEEFIVWLDNLFDLLARAKMQARIKRLSEGNPGNAESVGEKVFEMKIDFGPGYRVYYTKHGQTLTILLLGGDKKTQARDIKLAQRLARNL